MVRDRVELIPRAANAMELAHLRLDHARALLSQAGMGVPGADERLDEAAVQRIIDGLCELSQRDHLTGLTNRRAFLVRLAQELDRSSRSGESALLLMVDIDHFKAVNDRYGHLAGDAVIRAVASTLVAQVRPMDTVGRMGGEEFAVVFPNCTPNAGSVLAERIRRAVESTQVLLPDGLTHLAVTVSAGGAYSPAWVRSSTEHWLERADRQLYEAKHHGRNRVHIEPVPLSEVSAEEKDMLFAWPTTDGLIIDAADAV